MDFSPGWLNWRRTIGLPVPAKKSEISDSWRLPNGKSVRIRAVRPDDAPLLQELVSGLSLKSRYRRFFLPLHELPPAMLASFTRAEPGQALTLLAVVIQGGRETAVGMAQCMAGDYPDVAEFAIVVSDQWQRGGIATRLLHNLICVARAAGIERIEGDVLAENEPMLRLLFGMDFVVEPDLADRSLMRAYRSLRAAGEPSWKCSGLTALVKREPASPGNDRVAPAQ